MKILIIVFFLFLSLSKTDYEPLNFTEFQSMNRILNPILSPDDKYIVYSVQKWNPTTNKLSRISNKQLQKRIGISEPSASSD